MNQYECLITHRYYRNPCYEKERQEHANTANQLKHQLEATLNIVAEARLGQNQAYYANPYGATPTVDPKASESYSFSKNYKSPDSVSQSGSLHGELLSPFQVEKTPLEKKEEKIASLKSNSCYGEIDLKAPDSFGPNPSVNPYGARPQPAPMNRPPQPYFAYQNQQPYQPMGPPPAGYGYPRPQAVPPPQRYSTPYPNVPTGMAYAQPRPMPQPAAGRGQGQIYQPRPQAMQPYNPPPRVNKPEEPYIPPSQPVKVSLPPMAPTVPPAQPMQPAKVPLNDTSGLTPVFIPKNIIYKFVDLSNHNTKSNVETCGILCGIERDSGYLITDVVIPKQKGTHDTCSMSDEEELFEFQCTHKLITLGWIHTHPQYDCFLSSVDLHTHFSYQKLLKEALAIVYSPIDKTTIQAFRIKDEYMDDLEKCSGRGFHKHKVPNNQMFELGKHYLVIDSDQEKINANIHDLR